MLEALLLACSCQEVDRGSVGDKARRIFPPGMGRGSQTSFPSKVLGSDFQEVRSNCLDRADQIPNSTCVLAPCLGPNLKLAKQFKPVARTTETLLHRGRRTLDFQSGASFPVQPLRDHFFVSL